MAQRTPNVEMEVFKKRRVKLGDLIFEKALVIAAHPNYVRNNDVHHNYRQDSNFYYLTGFEEPSCVFVFRPGKTPQTVMFVQPKDIVHETWDGFRYGVEGVKQHFNIDEAYSIYQLSEKLPHLLGECDDILYKMNFNPDMDRIFHDTLNTLRARNGRSGKSMPSVIDPSEVLGELRLVKDEDEVELMKKACQISAEAHIELMKAAKPGVNERQLHGVFINEIMQRGAAREGYGTIVASGDSANTLHYVFNDQECKDGDLLLIDAGAEFGYYTGDITRTFPVNGKFSAVQKRIYQRVLDIQKNVCAMVKPGVTKKDLQDLAVEQLVELMIDEKILKGEKENIISQGEYRKFYPHGIGHYLGLDVHDAGLSEIDGEPRKLEAGMCLTIEPGLYIPMNTEGVPDEVKGIGIRIEDNLLVTESGNLNMTSAVPKEVDEIENLCQS